MQQTLNQPVFYGIPESPAVLAAINSAGRWWPTARRAGELDRVFRAFVDKATGGKNGARPRRRNSRMASSRSIARPAAGADRWFEHQEPDPHASCSTRSRPSSCALNKEGVREQIGVSHRTARLRRRHPA